MDAMPTTAEAEPNAIVPQPLTLQTLAHAGFDHQVDGTLFQNAGAHAVLNVLPAAALQDNRLDAGQMQKREHNRPRRSGPDNTDLGSHRCFSNLSADHRARRIGRDGNRPWP